MKEIDKLLKKEF